MTKAQTKFNDIMKSKSANAARQIVLRLMPEQTDEQRAEAVALTKEQGDIEARFTPALEAVELEQSDSGSNGDAAGVERRALIERADFGAYLDSSLSNRALGGAESELNAAVGAVAGNGGVPVPWEVLAGCRAPVEKRADATTVWSRPWAAPKPLVSAGPPASNASRCCSTNPPIRRGRSPSFRSARRPKPRRCR